MLGNRFLSLPLLAAVMAAGWAPPAMTQDPCAPGCDGLLIQQGSHNQCPGSGYYVQTTVSMTSGICLEDWSTGDCKGSPCRVAVHQEWSLPAGNVVQVCHVFLGRKFCLDPPPTESAGSNDYEQNLACNDVEHAYSTSGDAGSCGRLESLAKVKCTSCED